MIFYNLYPGKIVDKKETVKSYLRTRESWTTKGIILIISVKLWSQARVSHLIRCINEIYYNLLSWSLIKTDSNYQVTKGTIIYTTERKQNVISPPVK